MIFATPSGGTNNFYLKIEGPPFKRGQSIARKNYQNILKLYEKKQELYKEHLPFWIELANQMKTNIQKQAPVSYQELLGMSSVFTDKPLLPFLLATEYEMFMLFNPRQLGNLPVDKKCTGFATTMRAGDLTTIITGQTNDETASEWFDAKLDGVLHLVDVRGLESLIYTHPGYPAYMGLNSKGLSVLWQYVDDGERNLSNGLATTVLIRELLTKASLKDALSFLEHVPRTVPNNFIISQEGVGFVNVESTPTKITLSYGSEKEPIIHANHFVYDEALTKKDIGKLSQNTTTLKRYERMKKDISYFQNHLSADKAKAVLSAYPVLNKNTLASLFFELKKGCLNIRFKSSEEKGFKTYCFGEEYG